MAAKKKTTKTTKKTEEQILKEEDKLLTQEQELFCLHYVKNDRLRGNGTLSYNEAYNKGLYEADETRETDDEGREIPGTSEYDKIKNHCAVCASQALRRLNIQKKNRELFNELLTDDVVDARLSDILINGKHEVSLNAIKEYNKLKVRITDKKVIEVIANEMTPEREAKLNKLFKENGFN